MDGNIDNKNSNKKEYKNSIIPEHLSVSCKPTREPIANIGQSEESKRWDAEEGNEKSLKW